MSKFTPKTRLEKFLAKIAGRSEEELEPKTRLEAALDDIAENIGQGSEIPDWAKLPLIVNLRSEKQGSINIYYLPTGITKQFLQEEYNKGTVILFRGYFFDGYTDRDFVVPLAFTWENHIHFYFYGFYKPTLKEIDYYDADLATGNKFTVTKTTIQLPTT